jgi:hypothetical protein
VCRSNVGRSQSARRLLIDSSRLYIELFWTYSSALTKTRVTSHSATAEHPSQKPAHGSCQFEPHLGPSNNGLCLITLNWRQDAKRAPWLTGQSSAEHLGHQQNTLRRTTKDNRRRRGDNASQQVITTTSQTGLGMTPAEFTPCRLHRPVLHTGMVGWRPRGDLLSHTPAFLNFKIRRCPAIMCSLTLSLTHHSSLIQAAVILASCEAPHLSE